jgi:hypothetical protein
MKLGTFHRAVLTTAGLAFGSIAGAQMNPLDEAPAALYHSFAIAPGHAWSSESIALQVGHWHVGSVDGPLASEAQLRAALTSLARIAIGGRCAAVVEGATGYPCGFALQHLSVDGIDGTRLDGIAADAVTLATAGRGAAETRDVESQPAAPGQTQHLVQVVASVLGDAGARPGGRIAFVFRSFDNPLRPSSFDAASGVVELRARPRRSSRDAPAGRQSI